MEEWAPIVHPMMAAGGGRPGPGNTPVIHRSAPIWALLKPPEVYKPLRPGLSSRQVYSWKDLMRIHGQSGRRAEAASRLSVGDNKPPESLSPVGGKQAL